MKESMIEIKQADRDNFSETSMDLARLYSETRQRGREIASGGIPGTASPYVRASDGR